MSHRRILASAVLLTLCLSASVHAGDIRGWRNDGTGIFSDTDPPSEWGPGKHEVWSTDLGGGIHSSPVLIGDKVVTAVEPFTLICLSAKDGNVLWKTSNDLWKEVLSKEEATAAKKLAERAKAWLNAINEVEKLMEDAGAGMPGTKPRGEYVDMPLEKRMAIVKAAYVKRWELVQAKNRPAGGKWVSMGAAHGDGGSAAATPVTDGKYVYMVFANGLGICCDLATGKRVWYSKLPGEPGIQHHGTSGSSPALAGDIVVMRFGHWIYGLKTSDGTQVWEGREPEQWYRIRCCEHYAPLVVTIDKMLVVVTASGQFIRAADGKMLADLDLYATTGGPTRDGISPETDLFANLKKGPVVVWKASLGTGYTSIAIAGGLAYAAGNKDDKDTIAAFDAVTGKPAWAYSYDEPLNDNRFEGGPCATPTVAGGKLYSLSRSGNVICLDAATGKLIWRKDVDRELKADQPNYGYAGSPTVIGARLYLNIAAHGCCLEAATGKVIWKSPSGKAGYAPPIPFTSGERSLLLIFSSDDLYAVDAATGQVAMKYPWKDSESATAPAPLVRGSQVFLSSGFSQQGGVMLETAAGSFKEVWRTEEMNTPYNSGVEIDGFLYGFDAGVLRCLEWRTGKSRWEKDDLGEGSLVAAEGRLVILSEDGELVIAEAKPDAFHEVARGPVLKKTCWTRPAIAGGRIYCRNSGGDLVCVELK